MFVAEAAVMMMVGRDSNCATDAKVLVSSDRGNAGCCLTV